ncbi:MAG: tetratricopeptide repeat protein [Lachnospiraceae bacterium]|nr:tetratricopeptide repeat protein [Lachnospiraceae bacterium]
MKKWRLPLLVSAAALCLSLTGCLGQKGGDELIRQGMEKLESNDAAGALESFQAAREEGEEALLIYRGEGLAYMAQARYPEAVTCFQAALEMTGSRMPETVKDLKLYLVSALCRSGRYEETIELCKELLEAGPLTEAYYYMGAAYLDQGEEELAKVQFDQAVALEPSDYALYLQIYQKYDQNNLSAVGDAYLQETLKLPAESDEDRYHLGQIYFYLEKYEDAAAVLQEPMEKRYLPALTLLGEVYLAQNDVARAQSIYQNVRDEQGNSPQVLGGLALCAIKSGDYDGALSLIEQGLALEEETGKQALRFNEIVAYEGKLDFSTALVKAEAYVQLYPSDEQAQKELAFLRSRGQ